MTTIQAEEACNGRNACWGLLTEWPDHCVELRPAGFIADRWVLEIFDTKESLSVGAALFNKDEMLALADRLRLYAGKTADNAKARRRGIIAALRALEIANDARLDYLTRTRAYTSPIHFIQRARLDGRIESCRQIGDTLAHQIRHHERLLGTDITPTQTGETTR